MISAKTKSSRPTPSNLLGAINGIGVRLLCWLWSRASCSCSRGDELQRSSTRQVKPVDVVHPLREAALEDLVLDVNLNFIQGLRDGYTCCF